MKTISSTDHESVSARMKWEIWGRNLHIQMFFLQFIVYKSVQRQRYKNHETIQTMISFWNYHCLNQSLPSKHHFFKMFTSWWLNQPIWTICSSNWIISPSKGENKTCLKPPSIRGADKHSTLWLYFFIPFFSLLSSPWKNQLRVPVHIL